MIGVSILVQSVPSILLPPPLLSIFSFFIPQSLIPVPSVHKSISNSVYISSICYASALFPSSLPTLMPTPLIVLFPFYPGFLPQPLPTSPSSPPPSLLSSSLRSHPSGLFSLLPSSLVRVKSEGSASL